MSGVVLLWLAIVGFFVGNMCMAAPDWRPVSFVINGAVLLLVLFAVMEKETRP